MNQQNVSGGGVPASRYSNRRLPIGAEVMATEGVHFRVWAPKCERIEVVFAAVAGTAAIAPLQLVAEGGGYFAGVASAARAGMLYHLRLNGSDQLIPDPVSRFQPDGPHGPSQIIDPDPFAAPEPVRRENTSNISSSPDLVRRLMASQDDAHQDAIDQQDHRGWRHRLGRLLSR